MKTENKTIRVVNDGQAIHTDHDVTPEQAEKLIEALNKSDDKGQYVEYEGAYGTN